jgi:hypothetical protein
MTLKAAGDDLLGRFREIVSDPLNLLIERHPDAGAIEEGHVRLHNGHLVPIEGAHSYYGGFSQILAINRGVHEPLEEYAFQELLKLLPAAPLMVELGAYWGHYSMWLKKLRPQARVWLVEPSAKNLEAGRTNFRRNGFEAEFIQALVGDGELQVDAFLDEQGVSHLDVLHSDIQGAELQMIQGARNSLARASIDYVLVSTHSQKLHRKVAAELAAHGYRVEISSDLEGTTAHDGFLFATSPRKPPVFEGFNPLGREDICRTSPRSLAEYVWATARGPQQR